MNNIIVRQLLNYKLSCLVALIWFAELVLQELIVFHNERNLDGLLYEGHFYFLVVLTGFLFLFVYIAESAIEATWQRVAASLAVTAALAGVLFVWIENTRDVSFGARIIVILSALVCMGRPNQWSDDARVWPWQNSLVWAGLEAIVVSLTFLAFSALAVYLVYFVFEAQPYESVYLLYASISLVPCAVFIARMATHRENQSKLLAMIVTYLLTPLWLFYVALLNIYALRIAFQWSLPRGAVVTPVAIAFVIYVALWWGLKHLKTENAFGWPSLRLLQVTKILHLPLLALMFVAIGRRISEHGLTQPRYFIVLLAVLFSVILILDFAKRLNARNFALAFTGLCLLSFIPV